MVNVDFFPSCFYPLFCVFIFIFIYFFFLHTPFASQEARTMYLQEKKKKKNKVSTPLSWFSPLDIAAYSINMYIVIYIHSHIHIHINVMRRANPLKPLRHLYRKSMVADSRNMFMQSAFHEMAHSLKVYRRKKLQQ